MAIHTDLTPSESADRLAIRELFDAYAHCADRRDAEGQKALFTVDTRFAVYMDGEGADQPTCRGERRSRRCCRPEPVRRDDAFQRTEHCHDRRRPCHNGESYTIAHHLFSEDGIGNT